MKFGEKIRQLRKEKGLSQEELATLIGANSKSMICKIENGQRMTPINVVQKFAKALGVSVSDLLDEDILEQPADPVEEFVPYLRAAQEWQLDAVRKILDMPSKKICKSSELIG